MWRCSKAARYRFSCRWKAAGATGGTAGRGSSCRLAAGKAVRVGLLQAEQPKVNVVLQAGAVEGLFVRVAVRC